MLLFKYLCSKEDYGLKDNCSSCGKNLVKELTLLRYFWVTHKPASVPPRQNIKGHCSRAAVSQLPSFFCVRLQFFFVVQMVARNSGYSRNVVIYRRYKHKCPFLSILCDPVSWKVVFYCHFESSNKIRLLCQIEFKIKS